MGKLAKPQKSGKQKKIKAVDPFYTGDRKDRRQEGLNQKPQNLAQDVPKKLRRLGFIIDDVKTGKKSRNKFFTSPDAPVKYNRIFNTPMGAQSSDPVKSKSKKRIGKKIKEDPTLRHLDEKAKRQKDKKKKKRGLKTEDVEEYIDNLKPVNDYQENVQFKQEKGESHFAFVRRVNTETHTVLTKSKLADKFDISDEKKIRMMVKAKKSKMNEKKKNRLSEKKKKKIEAVKQKKMDRQSDFSALKDSRVEFGDVVHAPPVLSTRPKKAVVTEHDKPALRMPELTQAIERNIQEAKGTMGPLTPRAVGQTRKRKLMSASQRLQEDSRREGAVEAYRMMKKAKLKSK